MRKQAEPNFKLYTGAFKVEKEPATLQSIKPGTWKTAAGQVLALKDMETQHIINAMNLIERRGLQDEYRNTMLLMIATLCGRYIEIERDEDRMWVIKSMNARLDARLADAGFHFRDEEEHF